MAGINDNEKKRRNRQRDAVVGDVKRLRAEVRELKRTNRAEHRTFTRMLNNAAKALSNLLQRTYAREKNDELSAHARIGLRKLSNLRRARRIRAAGGR